MKLQFPFVVGALGLLLGCAHVTGTHPAVSESPAHVDFAVREKYSLDYLVHLPAGAGAAHHKFPAIIFLHGSGERGTNVWDVAKHGPPKLVWDQSDFPVIVLSPQCPPGDQWQPDAVAAFVELMKHQYPVDPDRVYLTGLSMGGSGTWSTLLKHPELFAAAVPICGHTDTNVLPYLSAEKLWTLKHLPIQVFHGAKDPEVNVKYSRQMTGALEKLGANVKLTVYPEALHDSWSQTYANPELYTWLLAQNRIDQKRPSFEQSHPRFAKRAMPKEVPPVILDGIKYTAQPHWELADTNRAYRGPTQSGGYIQARNTKTGELLWELKVYEVKDNPKVEEDVQDVFITSLKVVHKNLEIKNESGDTFILDLSARKIVKGANRVYGFKDSGD